MVDTATRSSIFQRAILGVAMTAGVLAVGGFGIMFFGGVSGQEFSPDTFQRRDFHYYQIPLVGIQVWPIFRIDHTGSLETLLRSQKVITPINTTNESWDLVYSKVSQIEVGQGDARILCHYLDSTDDKGNHYWEGWTKSHMPQAKVLWPLVAEISRARLYILVPAMFRIAQEETSPQKLSIQLKEYLADECWTLGQVQQQLERHELAIKLLSLCLQYAPEHEQALRARAESYEALGQEQEAIADRDALKQLNR